MIYKKYVFGVKPESMFKKWKKEDRKDSHWEEDTLSFSHR